MLKELYKNIDKINKSLEKSNIIEISYILNSKMEIFKRNLIAGISKGIGLGIGFTIITSIFIYFLQKIIALNIPIIGDYVSDIFQIIKSNSVNKLY